MPADISALQVALPLPLPRLFDYRAPAGLAATPALAGCRVRVPFGPRELVGVVAGVDTPAGDAPAGDKPELREVLACLDDAPLLHGELFESLRWLARYAHAPLGEVLATALPAALRRGEPLPDTHAWAWRLTEAGATALPGLRAGSRPRRLAELLHGAPRDEDALDALMDDWRGAARSLGKRELVERIAIAASQLAPTPQPGPEANAEQAEAIATIRDAQAGEDAGFAALLLDGVTGSGKTEVYLQAIADCLARGKQALVLVPEIGLTPQLLSRFRARLGVPVHATHSGLNDGERARTWAAALRGEARVVVGTRSAVFTPLPEAGLIVVDEEHDGSYKQQDGIRYHARDFALVRGKALGVPVLLGSATPSLESLHNARSGRYAHLRLTRRAGEAKPPRVRVLDVRKRPLEAGLSAELLDAAGKALDAGGQVLVFKNRRGYAPVLLCHDCGWSAQCKRCSTPLQGTPMTVHAGGRRLQCHHCGARQPVPLACPDCASLALQPQGIGTERIEELLAQRFDGKPVLRIDRGSTRRKDALEKHLDAFGAQAGVLIGTQMLAKGHDLPNLTLVCVVGIDEGLFSADFRAGEKLAQLLIQVAGRAGRADKPGEVLLQTHHPEHPLLQTLIAGGYHAFAEEELAQREMAGFPPFAHLALLRAEAKHADAPMQLLHAAKALLLPFAATKQVLATRAAPNGAPPSLERSGDALLELHGPLPAPMPRRAGMHRAQLLVSAANRRALHGALDAVMPALYALPEARKARWSLDVDPVDLY
ncbi:primosomal protein N' [Luteimonas sp. 22616]|uniref:primosomal protein N' n=1 Tax=Luteimonas sp. 22616 TaxID=3453951 RepID=UPI003F85C37A